MRSSRGQLNQVLSRLARKPKRRLPLCRSGTPQVDAITRRMQTTEHFRDLTNSVRHLTYHIFPMRNAEESWQWNLRQLSQRWSLFNGKRVLGVNVSPETADLDDVLAVSRSLGMEWDHVVARDNDPSLGEVLTWVPSLEYLDPDNAQPNEVVFSAHAKGVKYGVCPSLIREWTDRMYRANLDSWFLIKRQLEWYVATGAFKARFAGNAAYSGAFWWWRLHDIGKRNWRQVLPIYPGREVWIAGVANREETGCVFHDDTRDLYRESLWAKSVRPAWGVFEPDLYFRKPREQGKPIAYLISSHFSYGHAALPRLLDSMIKSGVKPWQIFIVMCGCRREFDQQTTRGTFWYVNHESRNFCTFLEAIDERRQEALRDFDHMFLVMDTSEAGPRFAELTNRFDRDYDTVGVNPLGSVERTQCDLGAYSFDHLREMRQDIETFRDAHWSVNWDWEGRVFGEAKRKTFYGRELWGQLPSKRTDYEHIGKAVTEGPWDVYGTGSLRITEYYRFIDMFRFKSNWGQNPYLLDRI